MKLYKFYILAFTSIISLNVIVLILIWRALIVTKTDKDSDNDKFQDYLIYNSQCKIPDYDSNDRRLSAYIQTEEYRSCWSKTLFTEIVKLNGKAFLVTRLPENTERSVQCCYSNVTPSTKLDYLINVTPCEFFDGKVQVFNDVVFAKCYTTRNQTAHGEGNATLVYQNVHAIVLLKGEVHRDLPHQDIVPERPNVLILGLSLVLRNDFYKILPQTYRFLKANHWVDYTAFNVVGDKMNANAIAMLTGSFTVSSDNKKDFVNGTDFIWEDFRKMGYVTAYVKDSLDNGVLQNSHFGFNEAPTDFYFRHYIVATHMLDRLYLLNSTYCSGPETTVERILNMAKDFMTEAKQRNTFGVFWSDGLNRTDVNVLKPIDEKLRDFFSDLHESGKLHNTLVFFLGDQGSDIVGAQTLKGWYSEQLPFLYVWVPPMLKQRYRNAYKAIIENRNHLTTPFDLYSTMQDLLEMYSDRYESKKKDWPRNVSLFRHKSNVRSCRDASIGAEWCSCLVYAKLKAHESRLVRLAVNYIVWKAKREIKRKKYKPLLGQPIELTDICYIWVSDKARVHDDSDVYESYMKIRVTISLGIDLRATLYVTYRNDSPSVTIAGPLSFFNNTFRIFNA